MRHVDVKYPVLVRVILLIDEGFCSLMLLHATIVARNEFGKYFSALKMNLRSSIYFLFSASGKSFSGYRSASIVGWCAGMVAAPLLHVNNNNNSNNKHKKQTNNKVVYCEHTVTVHFSAIILVVLCTCARQVN